MHQFYKRKLCINIFLKGEKCFLKKSCYLVVSGGRGCFSSVARILGPQRRLLHHIALRGRQIDRTGVFSLTHGPHGESELYLISSKN